MRFQAWVPALVALGADVTNGQSSAQQEFDSICPSQDGTVAVIGGFQWHYHCNANNPDYYDSVRSVGSADECANLCLESDACTAAIWKARAERCYVTESTAQPEIDVASNRYSLYMVRGEPAPEEPEPTECQPGESLVDGACVPDACVDPEREICEQKVDALEFEVDLCEQEKDVLTTQAKNCNIEKASCEAQKAASDAQVTASSAQVAALELDKATCDSQRAQLETDKAALTATVQSLQNELQSCKTSLDQANSYVTCPGAAKGQIRSISGKNFRLYCGHVTSTNNWKRNVGHNFESCLQLCAKDRNCLQFDFWHTTGHCFTMPERSGEARIRASRTAHAVVLV